MPQQWFCVRTSPRKEMAVAAALRLLDLEVYLPLEASLRKCRGVRRRVDRALIPSHLFYGVERGRNVFSAVRCTDDVWRILSTERDGVAREVPWPAIEIVQMVEADLLARFERRFSRLDEEARRGEDTQRFLSRLKAAPRELRVDVIYDMMGRGRKARLRLAELQQFV